MPEVEISGYRYANEALRPSHDYLLPKVQKLLEGLNLPSSSKRLFELGCGNGSVARTLRQRGWDIIGVDPSAEGIAQARVASPVLKLQTGSAYDDLARNGRAQA